MGPLVIIESANQHFIHIQSPTHMDKPVPVAIECTRSHITSWSIAPPHSILSLYISPIPHSITVNPSSPIHSHSHFSLLNQQFNYLMASTSFALPNHFTARRFSAVPPQILRQTHRVSAHSATAERASAVETRNLSQTASFYEVLGVQTGATCQEIKSAYRRLARTLHPDVASSGSSADEFMRVHAAYATLCDPEKRATYDSSLFRRRRAAVITMGGGFSDVTRGRSWETDQCW